MTSTTVRSSEPTCVLLGAAPMTPHGRDQVRNFVRQLHEDGVCVVGVDVDGKGRNDEYADLVVKISVPDMDPETIAKTIADRNIHPDAVVALHESYVLTAAICADLMKAKGHTVPAVTTVRDKYQCRRLLADNGLIQPEIHLIKPTLEQMEQARRQGGVWVVKPRDGMGSIGVHTLSEKSSTSDLESILSDPAIKDAAEVICERFVNGDEYSMELLVRSGCVELLQFTDKQKQGHVEIGHNTPPIQPVRYPEAAVREAQTAIRLTGVENALMHVEFWQQADGSIILGELHVRLGGAYLHRLIELTHPGIRLYSMWIESLIFGRATPLASGPQGSYVLAYVAPTETMEICFDPDDTLMKITDTHNLPIRAKFHAVRDSRDLTNFFIAETEKIRAILVNEVESNLCHTPDGQPMNLLEVFPGLGQLDK